MSARVSRRQFLQASAGAVAGMSCLASGQAPAYAQKRDLTFRAHGRRVLPQIAMAFTDLASVPLHRFQAIPNTAITHDGTTYPAGQPGGFSGSAVAGWITDIWNGAVWDEDARELICVGGGHSGAAWNIVFGFKLPEVGVTPGSGDFAWRRAIDMNDDWVPSAGNKWANYGLDYSPQQWVGWAHNIMPVAFSAFDAAGHVTRVNANRAGAAGAVLSASDFPREIAALSDGTYADGSPNSRHTYDGVVMTKSPRRRLWLGPGKGYPGGSNAGNTFLGDLTPGLAPENAWGRVTDLALSPPTSLFSEDAGYVWDSYNNQILAWKDRYVKYWKQDASGTVSQGTWNKDPGTTLNALTAGHLTLAMDTRRRHLYCLGKRSDGTNIPSIFRLKLGEADGTVYAGSTQHTVDVNPTLEGAALSASNRLGWSNKFAGSLVYDPVNDRLVLYDPVRDVGTLVDSRRVFACSLGGGPEAPTSYDITRLTEFNNGEEPTLDVNIENGVFGRFALIGDGLGVLFHKYNQPVYVFRLWTVDTNPPDTTITSAPPALTNSTTASFSFTTTEAGSAFECRLDGGLFADCVSPTTYSGLGEGAHTFEVRARDAAGNPDPTPATYSWTVDSVPPETTIISGPSGPTASTTATFSFSATEAGSTFACSLDSAPFSPCTSPITFTGLAEGPHTFQVRATDAAGNPDATPATRTWTVDTQAPNTTITSGPSGNTTSTTATFTFSSTDTESGSTFACSLDRAAFTACVSPITYTGLSSGAHTFQVRAIDAAGNVDPSPAKQNWRVR